MTQSAGNPDRAPVEVTQGPADRARAAHRITDMRADVTKMPDSMTKTPMQVEPAFEEQWTDEEEA